MRSEIEAQLYGDVVLWGGCWVNKEDYPIIEKTFGEDEKILNSGFHRYGWSSQAHGTDRSEILRYDSDDPLGMYYRKVYDWGGYAEFSAYEYLKGALEAGRVFEGQDYKFFLLLAAKFYRKYEVFASQYGLKGPMLKLRKFIDKHSGEKRDGLLHTDIVKILSLIIQIKARKYG